MEKGNYSRNVKNRNILRSVILWGATGQSKVLEECLNYERAKVIALFDNDPNVKSSIPNVPIYYGMIGFKKWLAKTPNYQDISYLVAIGGERGKDRLEIYRILYKQGLNPITAIHPTSFVASNSHIGMGTQILAQSAVCAEVELGEACIINTSASVDHECRLGDGVHICPGAHLGGCVKVGNYAMVGIGATVLPKIKIGEGAIVGAGALVVHDVEPYTTVAGCPARVLKKNQ